jgi:flavorubredoxin
MSASATTLDAPIMLDARPLAADWTLLPAWAPLPGLGALAVNQLLLKGKEPVLVDTGLAPLGDRFLATLARAIDLDDIRWIWISHADADHIGNLQSVLDRAPRAKVVTQYLGAAKLALLGFDMGRVEMLQPGQAFEAGGRKLHPVRPLYYDAPETAGFYDSQAGLLYVVDCFGAVLPAPVHAVEDADKAAFRAGMMTWSALDAPWLHRIDRGVMARGLDALERLAPKHLVSAHLPMLEGSVTTLTRPIAEAYCAGLPSQPDPLWVETALAA